MKENLSEIVQFRLSTEQVHILEERAAQLGTSSLSVAFRAILTEWAREHNGQARPQTEEQVPA
jgi:hypothetical protein